MGPVAAGDVPKAIAGYDTVINDATYFNEATLGLCSGLKHIVFLGTGAASFVDLAAAAAPRHQRSRPSAATATPPSPSTPWAWCSPPRAHIATMHGLVRAGGWRPMQGMELKGKTLGHRRPGRHRPRDGAHRQGVGLEAHRLQPVGDRRPAGADGDARRTAGAVGYREPASWPQRRDARLPRSRQAREDQARRHRRQHGAGRRCRRAGADRSPALRPCRPLRHRRVRPGAA